MSNSCWIIEWSQTVYRLRLILNESSLMSRLHTLRDQEQVIQFVTHEIVELSTCAINYLGTNESGIDVNQHTKSGAKRQQLPSVGNIDSFYILWDHKSIIMLVVFCIDLSEMGSDIMSSPDILSDEGTEDEGIGEESMTENIEV